MRTAIACCACLLALGLARAATLDPAQWSHAAEIRLPDTPSAGLAELALPPAVFAAAAPDLSDLRVVTAANTEVGYVLREDAGSARSEPVPVRLYNRAFVPGESARVTVDAGGREMKNRMEIDTSGAMFRRIVVIEGSDDGTHWQVIRDDAMLFRAYEDGRVVYDKTEVTFPDNNQRYLRVTVRNGPGDPGTIAIRDVALQRYVATAAKTVDVPLRDLKVAQRGRTTVVTAGSGYRHLPLRSLTLRVGDEFFFRRASVFGRNAETEVVAVPVEDAPSGKKTIEAPLVFLGSAAVYRYPGETNLTIPLAGAASRFLKVEIANEDNPPLTVTGLSATRLETWLAFTPEPGQRYRLLAGNPLATAPSYDLAHFAGRLRAQGVAPATLGPLTGTAAETPRAAQPPWARYNQLLLWAALLAVFLVLLFLIRRQLRTAKALDANEP